MRAFLALLLVALLPFGAALADETLFDRMGGKPALSRIATHIVDAAIADPVIGAYFKDANVPRLKGLLTAHFCQVTGGGCSYPGRNMQESHAGLNIDDRAFNRLVEILQSAMDAEGIPFSTQNEFLALLAPMHPDVVNR